MFPGLGNAKTLTFDLESIKVTSYTYIPIILEISLYRCLFDSVTWCHIFNNLIHKYSVLDFNQDFELSL